MNQPLNQVDRPVLVEVEPEKDRVLITLESGVVIGTPLHLHPWLANAPLEQQINYEPLAFSVYWPDLDEGLDIEWMVRQALPASLKKMLTPITA